jgi:hypothetical protein
LRSVIIFDLPNYECVITHDQVVRKGHVSLRGTALLVLQRETGKKLIESLTSAIERFNLVLSVELLNQE